MVPWDTLRVPGVWILGRSAPRILPIANSCIWGLSNCPELVACVTQAENPKPVGARCDVEYVYIGTFLGLRMDPMHCVFRARKNPWFLCNNFLSSHQNCLKPKHFHLRLLYGIHEGHLWTNLSPYSSSRQARSKNLSTLW